jgi:altronate dehydratase small subunit
MLVEGVTVKQSAIVIDKRDNVAMALRKLERGEYIQLKIEDRIIDITLSQTIPCKHKFALKDIELGGAIIKYGEVIGLATRKIIKGGHTHVHNVEGLKGRGDKQ